jgi:hypothetical protein
MPARRDLDPGDIPALLPYLMIVDKVDDGFRYRLVGTATAREIGHDPTGSIVGSYALECAAAARAIYERGGHRTRVSGCDLGTQGLVREVNRFVQKECPKFVSGAK